VEIKLTLRSGNEYFLMLSSAGVDADVLFVELAAGRSQALRGWVAVTSEKGERTVVRGDEIVEMHFIDENERS
jgi:hypothetical protein